MALNWDILPVITESIFLRFVVLVSYYTAKTTDGGVAYIKRINLGFNIFEED
ncbi:MAG: hypothetical protein ACJ0A3_01605 [Dehalococcoidia bacterium]